MPKNNIKMYLLLPLIGCLTGCGFRNARFSQASVFSSEDQARVHDISFPLTVPLEKLLFNEQDLIASFVSKKSQEELLAEYRASMEYWGWHELGGVTATESCLMFSKPNKICSLVFRQEGSSVRVVVFSTLRALEQ